MWDPNISKAKLMNYKFNKQRQEGGIKNSSPDMMKQQFSKTIGGSWFGASPSYKSHHQLTIGFDVYDDGKKQQQLPSRHDIKTAGNFNPRSKLVKSQTDENLSKSMQTGAKKANQNFGRSNIDNIKRAYK